MIPYIDLSHRTIITRALVASISLFSLSFRNDSKKITYSRLRHSHWSSAIFCALLARAAARSICPTDCPPPVLVVVGMGLLVAGLPTGGFGGALGFAATGGGGFGLFATGGGGLLAIELDGLEPTGVLSDEPLVGPGAFFHGVADPLDGAMPGKTDTGFADESATTDLICNLATVVGTVEGVAEVEGGARRLGGGGGAPVALGFGGTSSR